MASQESVAVELVKEMAGSFLPGASTVIGRFRKAIEDRSERRLQEFLAHVWGGNPTEAEVEEVSRGPEWESYLKILQRLQADEESEKTSVYSATFKALLQKKIPTELKSDFLHAVSDLRFQDLCMLCQMVGECRKAMEKTRTDLGGQFSGSQLSEAVMKEFYFRAGCYTDNKHQAPAIYHGQIHRWMHAGVLSPKCGDVPPLPNELASQIMVLLGDVMAEIWHENHRLKPRKALNFRNGQFSEEQPPAEGWTREQLARW